jgi:amidase
MKFGVTSDLGLIPVDSEVASIVESAASVFADLGGTLTRECPDFSDAMEIFQTQRAASLAVTGHLLEQTLPDWRAHAKDTAIWNIEQGFALTADEIIRSELQRTELYRQVSRFFEQHDALLLPAAQVPPFDSSLEWIREINGQPMPTYIDWMTVCCVISVTGLPAISVPAGFTESGLPVGLQIVGKPRGDFELLQIAHAFEAATHFGMTRPEFAG